ncbi:MAG: DUF1294 domain-containing protein [Ruminococcaceae bacterium]|nr:DUF1294 domain-containing protein [Oscillospiraceae bacterium]
MLLTQLAAHKDEIIAVLAAINIVAFCLCAYDKSAAMSKKLRVPEKILLAFAIAFGSAGMLVGMYLFRHKTRKPVFFITVPVMLVLHAIVLYKAGIIS